MKLALRQARGERTWIAFALTAALLACGVKAPPRPPKAPAAPVQPAPSSSPDGK